MSEEVSTLTHLALITLGAHAQGVYGSWVYQSVRVCVCVKKRKEGESCGKRGVVTETGGGLVSVIKAPECASTYYY